MTLRIHCLFHSSLGGEIHLPVWAANRGYQLLESLVPEGAVHLAESAAFPNQAFALDQVLALQFHLEAKPDWVKRLSLRDADQLGISDTVQSAEAMLAAPEETFLVNNLIMERVLDRWLSKRTESIHG